MDDQRLRLLVVTAHPHDFTHCAGTCGIHTSRGDTVTVVSVGSGVYTHNERLQSELMKPPEERDPAVLRGDPEEYAALKAEELRKACALFGITDVRILGLPEPFRLVRSPEAAEALKDVILELRPHVMITQSPYFTGPHRLVSGASNDHTEVAYASLEARQLAATPKYGSSERPHQIAATYFPGVYFEKDQFDFAVDISEWFEQRVQAEMMFRTQGHTDAWARRRISVTVGSTGWFLGTTYAEAFVRERAEVLPRIVVSERDLQRAEEAPVTHMRRLSGLPPEAESAQD
jgi:LmbE family N-acetylglucosaminyl deacetylase